MPNFGSLAATIAAFGACAALLPAPAGAADNLSVTEFGAWADAGIAASAMPAGSSQLSAATQLTPLNGLPKTGSATYTGFATGNATIDSAPYRVTGAETLSVNFGPQQTFNGASPYGSVAMNFTLNKQPAAGGPTTPFVTLRTGNPFSAIQNFAVPITAAPGQGFTYTAPVNGAANTGNGSAMVAGSVNGAFYGPQAQATSGNWTLANVPGAASTITAQGSFTAHR
jgi:hypothetical protein